jgi:hypothetical protein
MRCAVRRAAWIVLSLVVGCDKEMPTQPVLPTPTPAPSLSLAGAWTGTISSPPGNQPTPLTARTTQTGQTVHIAYRLAGESLARDFNATLSGAHLEGPFCRGNVCGCSAFQGTASSSHIQVRVDAGSIFLECFVVVIELSR